MCLFNWTPGPFFVERISKIIKLILTFIAISTLSAILGCGYFNVEVKASKQVSSLAVATVSIQKNTLPQSITIQEGDYLTIDIELSKILDYDCLLDLTFEGTQGELVSRYFNLSMATVSIPAGQTSATFFITPLDDTIYHALSQWHLSLKSKTPQIESIDSLEFYLDDNDINSSSAFGKTKTNFATMALSSETATVAQTLSDGKILTAGYSNASGSNDFTVIKYNSAGALDITFGSNGKILTDIGTGSNDQAFAMQIQADGKIVVAGTSNPNGNNDFTMVRYTSAGILDNSFGTNGKVVTDIGAGSSDFIQSLQLQADGKILLAGYSNVNGENDFTLVRYNSNGKIDLTFGTNGKLITNVSANDFVYSMKLQSDGKIILAGASFNNNYDFSMIRYTPDGALDVSFGTNGKVLTDIGANTTDYGKSIELQSDGKIVFAGTSNNGTSTDIVLVRYTLNGVIDTSFGTNGKVITDVVTNTTDQVTSLQIHSSGKILVGGYVSSFNNDFLIMQYNNSGALDTSFGLNGKVITDLNSNSKDIVYDLKIQPSGKILVAGSTTIGATSDFALVRYLATGDLDTIFGTTGIITTDVGTGSSDVVTTAQIQSNEKIVLAGYSDSNLGGHYDFALARYNPNDSIDMTFGTNGKVTTDFNSGSNDYITSMDQQNDSKIIVVGYTELNGAYDLALARYNFAGAIDLTFGNNGKVITDINSLSMDKPHALKLQSDGKILVAGTTKSGNNLDFVVVRYTKTGTLDSSFGTNGKVITDIGTNSSDEAYSMQIQNDGKILLGGISNLNGSPDFTLVRYTSTGALDANFGTNGKVVTNINSNDYAYAMEILNDGKILMAGTSNVMGSNDYVLMRYTSTGAIDASFGNNGMVAVDIGINTNDSADSLTIKSDGTILLSGYTRINGKYNTTIVQLTSSGSLDPQFGTNGKVITDISSNFIVDHNPIHIQSTGNIIVGSTSKEFDFSSFDFLLGSLDPFGNPTQ